MSVEEIVMELIIAYNNETKENNSVTVTIGKLKQLLNSEPNALQTRVVFRAILNNTIKLRFEEDFTDHNGKPIKRIRELLEIDDGARKWHKTYRKYGIRHTRHQTYNLSSCDSLDKLNKTKAERYKNLPVWPRRDGKVICLLRDDVFFDSLLNVRRDIGQSEAIEIKMEDLPNIDKMTGDEEVKKERFADAVKIFDYINNSMSGGDALTHEPQYNKYESVDIDDDKMVDYKLALVNRLMVGTDSSLGSISKKVLLFAENNREEIIEWFKYQKCQPLYTGEELDGELLKKFEDKWRSYGVQKLGSEWMISENTEDLNKYDGNLLVIIDPKRYEKGVDLQKADTIINFDINYDPLKMEQRIGRIDRIRPKGQSQEINIISFVPLNNMSGFVINFFAYELKMFTQWMGETTGIVSVPDEDNASAKGQQVSFEAKVYELEKYYNYLYEMCKGDVPASKIKTMVEEYNGCFDLKDKEYITKSDFEFLQKLRKPFDIAFRNSISPRRQGYSVDGSDKKVMRFNSGNGVFVNCNAETCENCSNSKFCQGEGVVKRNISADFINAIKDFCNAGPKFYAQEIKDVNKIISEESIQNQQSNKWTDISKYLREREEKFKELKKTALAQIEELKADDTCFTIPYEKFNEIFEPVKQLYWDEVALKYINMILGQFYKQCDSVLDSAKLFERFIKMLSIADFMNNMDGNA